MSSGTDNPSSSVAAAPSARPLLRWLSPAGRAQLPEVLRDPVALPWPAAPPRALPARLMAALEVAAAVGAALRPGLRRGIPWGAPRTVDLAATRARTDGLVVLHAGADGPAVAQVAGDLLDANPLLARLAGYETSWQRRPPHAWTAWDRALAWAEAVGEPHGAQFDAPAAWLTAGGADGRALELPLLGWRLDVAAGPFPRAGHGEEPFVALLHPRVKVRRSLRLEEVPGAIPRGLSPWERLTWRPVTLGGFFGAGTLTAIQLDEGTATATVADGEPVSVSIAALSETSPEVAALVEELRAAARTEQQRRLEAHAAAGGRWVLPEATRSTSQRPRLPLTGWTLADDAFRDHAAGLVHLAHPREPGTVTVAARAAERWMGLAVPAAARLFGDPCLIPGGAQQGFLRSVDADGLWLSPDPDSPPGQGAKVTHSAWVAANPDLAAPLLEAVPELGWRTTDAQLRPTLAHLYAEGVRDLEPWAVRFQTPAPWAGSPLARALLREARDRSGSGLEVRWQDPGGAWWRWVGADDAGNLTAVAEPLARLQLPGPSPVGQHWFHARAAEVRQVRALTPGQLAWIHPALAGRLRAYQDRAGVLDAAGQPLSLSVRVTATVERVAGDLEAAAARVEQHIHMARDLKEGPKRIRDLQRHAERLRASARDLRGGEAVRVRVRDALVGRVGVALSLGGASRDARRAADDRVRIHDGLRGAWLGPLTLAMVAGCEDDAVGGREITRLLERLERAIGKGVLGAVDLREAGHALRDAFIEVGHDPAREAPLASVAALLIHQGSGRAVVAWAGSACLWRLRTGQPGPEPLTRPVTFDGLAALLWDLGLDPANALSAALHLTGRRVRGSELAESTDDDLVRQAERYRSGGRRSALRGGLGLDLSPLREEHDRLLALLDTYRDHPADPARPNRVHAGAAGEGEAMVFLRHLTPRPGDRYVLATDGLYALLEAAAREVVEALAADEPARAGERLSGLAAALDAPTDDLAALILDPLPARVHVRPAWARHDGKVFAVTDDQEVLLDGGVVPPLPDGSLPAIRIVGRKLQRWYAEVETSLQRGRIPEPRDDARGFVEAVMRWAAARRPDHPAADRVGEPLRDLHDALAHANDDPLDDVLITLFQLRRRGIPTRLVRGVRVLRQGGSREVADTAWLDVRIGRTWHLVDPTLGFGPRPRSETVEREVALGNLFSRARGTATWMPDPVTHVHIPYPEDLAADTDPWEHVPVLRHDGGAWTPHVAGVLEVPPEPSVAAASAPSALPRPTTPAAAPMPSATPVAGGARGVGSLLGGLAPPPQPVAPPSPPPATTTAPAPDAPAPDAEPAEKKPPPGWLDLGDL